VVAALDEPTAVRHVRDRDRLLDRARDAQEWRQLLGFARRGDSLVRRVGFGERLVETRNGYGIDPGAGGAQALDMRLDCGAGGNGAGAN
jgi:hypothetical protein